MSDDARPAPQGKHFLLLALIFLGLPMLACGGFLGLLAVLPTTPQQRPPATSGESEKAASFDIAQAQRIVLRSLRHKPDEVEWIRVETVRQGDEWNVSGIVGVIATHGIYRWSCTFRRDLRDGEESWRCTRLSIDDREVDINNGD